MRRTTLYDKRGVNQILLHIGNLLLGVVMALPFIMHAAYGITYSNVNLVAQDLGMTVNTMMSVPTPIQVQYQPDTADYLISISPREIRVEGSDGTGRHLLYGQENPSVTTGTASFEPTITLVSNERTLGFEGNRNRLSTFCEAIDVPRSDITVQLSAPNEASSVLESIETSFQDSEAVTISDDTGILVRLERVSGDDILIRYKETEGSRLPTEIACRAVVNAESQTQAFTQYNIQQDSELPDQSLVVEIGGEADYSAETLGTAIATGITASTNE